MAPACLNEAVRKAPPDGGGDSAGDQSGDDDDEHEWKVKKILDRRTITYIGRFAFV